MPSISSNLDEIRQRIYNAAKRVGRNPDEITLIAVSKKKPVKVIQEAINAGQIHFGENYVQEAKEKIPQINNPHVKWHFIGHLQSNKAKFVVHDYYMVQTVDSIKLANELGKRAVTNKKELPILIEVNVSGEKSKAGVAAEKAGELILQAAAVKGIKIRGLMTMPPFLPAEKARPYFITLRDLRDRLAATLPPGASLDHLSMGMSGDFEVAVEEGATLVRVGTSIFGKRL